MCANDIKERVQPVSNKTRAGMEPIESVPVTMVISSKASTANVGELGELVVVLAPEGPAASAEPSDTSLSDVPFGHN